MSSTADSKSSLRAAMLDRRLRLSTSFQEEAGAKTAKRLLARPEVFKSLSVGLYWAFQREMPTQGIFQLLRGEGKHVYLPRLNQKTDKLEFVPLEKEDQLLKGSFGIFEPAPFIPPVSLDEIGVFIVPGVAFDVRGHRLGWGKGFYDSVLKNFSGRKIGLGYDFQVVENLPAESHDQPVEVIVTEMREIDCQSRSAG